MKNKLAKINFNKDEDKALLLTEINMMIYKNKYSALGNRIKEVSKRIRANLKKKKITSKNIYLDLVEYENNRKFLRLKYLVFKQTKEDS